jgi:hypothetical protein
MTIGMLLSALSFVVAALVQLVIDNGLVQIDAAPGAAVVEVRSTAHLVTKPLIAGDQVLSAMPSPVTVAGAAASTVSLLGAGAVFYAAVPAGQRTASLSTGATVSWVAVPDQAYSLVAAAPNVSFVCAVDGSGILPSASGRASLRVVNALPGAVMVSAVVEQDDVATLIDDKLSEERCGAYLRNLVVGEFVLFSTNRVADRLRG